MRTTRLALLLTVLAAGCGGGMTATLNPNPQPTPASKVSSVVPSCATPLASGASEPCTVAVMGTGSFNTAVNWSASAGTISTAGVLTASSVTAAASITVTATSVEDSVSGTATVNVMPPAIPPPTVASVSVSCVSPVNSGAASQCSGTVSPAGASQTLSWSASGGTSITQTGLLTAPTVTANTTVIVTATSTADATKAGMFTVAVTAPPAPPPPPPPPAPLSLGEGVEPVIVVDSSGNIDVAWVDQADGVGEVFFSRSTDGGLTFSPEVTVSSGFLPQQVRMVVDSKGAIGLIWPQSNGDAVFVSHSVDGKSFATPVQLFTVASFDPQLVVDSNDVVYAVWFEFLADQNLHIARSTDGLTYSAPVQVWMTPASHDGLDLTLLAGRAAQVYLFWVDENDTQCDVTFASTTDGMNFSKPLNVSNLTGSCSNTPTAKLDHANAIDVAWETGQFSVFFARSTDGVSFSQPVNVVGATTVYSVGPPDFAVETDNSVDLVWSSEIVDYTELYSHSADAGATFSVPTTISLPPQPNFTGGGDGVVSVDSCGTITIAWDDDGNGSMTGDADIYEVQSTDSGKMFSEPVNLTNGPTQVLPELAVDAKGNTFVVWQNLNGLGSVMFERVGQSCQQ